MLTRIAVSRPAAPVAQIDFQPAVMKEPGYEYAEYGRAASDIPEGEYRERYCFSIDFPELSVGCSTVF